MTEPTVFLGEDDPQLRDIFADWLRETYHVRDFGSGDALLDALSPSVDAVVCDWHIRGTAEQSLVDALDRAGGDPAVVVVSGVAPRQDLSRYGVADFLEKPIGRDAFREAVDAALGRTVGPTPKRPGKPL